MTDKDRMVDGKRNDHSANGFPVQPPHDPMPVKNVIQLIREHENDLQQKRSERRYKERSVESNLLRVLFELNRQRQHETADRDLESRQIIFQYLRQYVWPSTDSTTNPDPSPSTDSLIHPFPKPSIDQLGNSSSAASMTETIHLDSEVSSASKENLTSQVSAVQATNLNTEASSASKDNLTSQVSPSQATNLNSEAFSASKGNLTSQVSAVQATNLNTEASSVSKETSFTASKTPKGLSPETKKYQEEIAREADQLRDRYGKVSKERQIILSAYIRHVLNVLRPEIHQVLMNNLSEFFSGTEKKVANRSAKIMNDEERLVALSFLANGICNQLLGSDMNEDKALVFLPFIQQISKLSNQPEFRVIFLGFLYKICPYTVPSYPEYSPNATRTEKLKALGYIERKEGNITRLEDEVEFLNRMTGLIRLYCKLLACGELPIGTDPRIAWRWIADLLNMEPIENMSAILVRVFLCEVGNNMMKRYRTHFGGLVVVIKSTFIKKLERVTNNHEMELLRQTLKSW